MSCVLKPTVPTSCSSDLYVACPTIINVQDWLMVHHTTVPKCDCCGKEYHIFATAEFPLFAGSKREYISTNVAIPLGPVSVELATDIDVRTCVPHRDQVTIGIKYPLLPSVKAGTYVGDLRVFPGIHMAVGVPEVYGTINMFIQEDFCSKTASLWVEFDLMVFGVEYKGKFAVLPIPYWFILSNTVAIAAKGAADVATITSGGELQATSISVHNETNNITNIVAPDAVAVAAVTPPAQ